MHVHTHPYTYTMHAYTHMHTRTRTHTHTHTQIRSSGGPMPHTTITYSNANNTVATVDDAGLIEAFAPGNDTITGKVDFWTVKTNMINDSIFLVTGSGC